MLEVPGVARVQDEAFLRDFGGGQDQVAELPLAIMLHGKLISRERARHAAGQRAGLAEFRIGVAIADEHIRRGGGWRHFTTVYGHQRPIRTMDKHEAASADAGVIAIDHSERQGNRHARVDGITALFEHAEPGFGRNWMD